MKKTLLFCHYEILLCGKEKQVHSSKFLILNSMGKEEQHGFGKAQGE